MNKQGQRSMKMATKNVSGIWIPRLRLEGQNLGQLLVIKYIKNYSYQNMSIIKVVLLFLYSFKNEKKSEKF